MMTNNQVWFSHPQDFNDPSDCQIRYSVTKICAEYDGAIEIVSTSLDLETYGLNFELEETV